MNYSLKINVEYNLISFKDMRVFERRSMESAQRARPESSVCR